MKIKNKKLMFLILLMLILIIFVPILVLGLKKDSEVPILTDEMIYESNKKEKERLLEEKKKLMEEAQNNSNILSDLDKNKESNYKIDENPISEEALNEAIEKGNKRIAIIKKYYPKEYELISNNIKEENNNVGIKDIKNTPLTENEKKLYELIIKILENENLSEEESDLLKEYLIHNMHDIRKDDDLITKTDKILNE